MSHVISPFKCGFDQTTKFGYGCNWLGVYFSVVLCVLLPLVWNHVLMAGPIWPLCTVPERHIAHGPIRFVLCCTTTATSIDAGQLNLHNRSFCIMQQEGLDQP